MVYLVPFVILAIPIALAYLEKKEIKKTLEELTLLPLPKISPTFYSAIKIFCFFFASLIILSVVFSLAGFSEPDKVKEIITKQGLLTLLLTVTIGPIGEELLFRGFLQKRMGITISSTLFAALHFGYGSVSEVLAAFFFSVISGLEYRKTKNIYACILAHTAFNAMALIVFFATG